MNETKNETCAFCGVVTACDHAIFRDGPFIGPEVPLCDGCADRTDREIWERIAQPNAAKGAYRRTPTSGILPALDTSDWHEAFAYAANETRAGGGNGAAPQPTEGFTGSLAPFDREDVAAIIALSEGEKDERPWLGVFRLKDGRYAALVARCDHTGWDCQASGDSWVAYDLDAIIRWGLTEEYRKRLGLPLLNPDWVTP